MELYARLRDQRSEPLGPRKWSGNQRWFAAEMAQPLAYDFQTYPINEDWADHIIGQDLKSTVKSLFRVQHSQIPPLLSCTYIPDGTLVETANFQFEQYFPWGIYGCLMQWRDIKDKVNISIHWNHGATVTLEDNGCVIEDGPYTLSLQWNGTAGVKKAVEGIELSFAPFTEDAELSAAYHVHPAHAKKQSSELLLRSASYLQESAAFWNLYLLSCPVHKFPEDYKYMNPSLGAEVSLNKEIMLTRQYWHWWAALINVSDVEFNDHTPFMAPDRNSWHGTWSNDGPETLCGLALTNQKELAGRCLAQYIRTSITNEGDLGWYTHSYGITCLQHPHDSGYYSHGVPCIVHAVEFYIRHTGDAALLELDGGHNMTVWDKISKYMNRVFEVRDPNKDGLIEWAHLWETGWDDKVSPFFSDADITEWIRVISENNEDSIEMFYKDRQFPVTTIVEQVYMLWALDSAGRLAELKGNSSLQQSYYEKAKHIRNVIESRHWNEQEGFYMDWDVQNSKLSNAKSLDGFYYLYFSKDSQRIATVIERLEDTNKFALQYPPTLSKDHECHNPQGYWTGSYWPREMLYMGLALNRAGRSDLAEREVIKALCSQSGCIISEHMDPNTGENLGGINTMAYCVGLNIALLEINIGHIW